jgi:hypothetical protein
MTTRTGLDRAIEQAAARRDTTAGLPRKGGLHTPALRSAVTIGYEGRRGGPG